MTDIIILKIAGLGLAVWVYNRCREIYTRKYSGWLQ